MKLKQHLSGVKLEHRDFTSYLISWWGLVYLSMLLIRLPFRAGGQAVNLYGIELDQRVDSQALAAAVHTTMIFYPLLLTLAISVLAVNLYDIKNDIKHREVLFYLSLLTGLVALVSQHSCVFSYPWLLLAAGILVTEMWPEGIKLWTRLINWIKNRNWSIWSWRIWPIVSYLLGLLIINYTMFVINNNFGFKRVLSIAGVYLSTIAVFLLFWLLFGITGRFWGSVIWVTVIYDFFYLFSIVMRYMRNDAIVPADMTMLKAVNSLAKMVSPILVVAMCLVIGLVSVLGHVLKVIYPIAKPKLASRLTGLVIAGCFYGSTAFWNHPGMLVSDVEYQTGFNAYFFNQAKGAQWNGPLWQFLQNVDIQTMRKPSGYSKSTMSKIAKSEQSQARIINRSRHQKLSNFTVIYNLSESFADPRRVPGVTYQGEAIPFIKHFKTMTNSGLMMSSGFGGGTANMEYMTLTGMPTANFLPTMSVPFTQLVPFRGNYQPSIARRFKYSVGIHPYNNQFYDRATDYPKLGIQMFYNLSDPKHPIKHQYQIENDPYMSDKTAYANVMDELNRYHKPQFIDLVTMQNHMPYDNKYDNVDHWQANVGGQATDVQLLEQYLSGISYTDTAVKQFVSQINDVNRPIAWVFYGDHLPGFYTNNWQTDGVKLHQTDYWIYLNPAARRKVGINSDVIEAPVTDPTEFTPLLLSNLNAKVTPFEALETQVTKQIPAKSVNVQGDTGAEFFDRRTGKVVSSSKFTKSQKKLWHEYKLVQYDQTSGRDYLKHDDFYREYMNKR